MIVVIITEPSRNHLTGLAVHPLLRRRELDGGGMPRRALPHRRLIKRVGTRPAGRRHLSALSVNLWHRKQTDDLRSRRHAQPERVLAIPLPWRVDERRNCRKQNISVSRRTRPRPDRRIIVCSIPSEW